MRSKKRFILSIKLDSSCFSSLPCSTWVGLKFVGKFASVCESRRIVGVFIPNFSRIQFGNLSADSLHLFQHDLIHFLVAHHELGHSWGNVRGSMLVKLRYVALVRKQIVLVEITVAIFISLLELSVPLVILI
jgi:hypothetical protein